MKLSTQSHLSIEEAIKKAVNKFAVEEEQTFITDIHLQPRQSSGELCIFDDNDKELVKTKIPEWTAYDKDEFYEDAERMLRSIINKLKGEGIFDKLPLMKPYSFVLMDEDYETVTDLFLMDDDTLMVNGELLPGLDKELDEFLKQLLKD